MVRDRLREIGKQHGLVDDDIKSTTMGESGVDIQLSPAARRVVDLAIECKNVEKLNVVGVFIEHFTKYASQPSLKLLVHSRNHTEPMVTMRWDDFIPLLERVASKPSE